MATTTDRGTGLTNSRCLHQSNLVFDCSRGSNTVCFQIERLNRLPPSHMAQPSIAMCAETLAQARATTLPERAALLQNEDVGNATLEQKISSRQICRAGSDKHVVVSQLSSPHFFKSSTSSSICLLIELSSAAFAASPRMESRRAASCAIRSA